MNEHPDRLYVGLVTKWMSWDEKRQAYVTEHTVEEQPLGVFPNAKSARALVRAVLDATRDLKGAW